MTFDQVYVFTLFALVLGLLIWGRVRYDLVAFGGLLLAVAGGVVSKEQAFAGFGHPATVIIALVLVISYGLSNSGAVDVLAGAFVDPSRSRSAHIGVMATLASTLSTVMNNVAALALLMPVDMQAAAKARRTPAMTLMPLSFASILGGMVTLIGTPPNIVIAAFRGEHLGESFRMFDFAPVGVVVASLGVVYVVLLGWRLIPLERRKRDSLKELKELADYVSEALVAEEGKFVGKSLSELDPVAEEHEVSILGLIRRGKRFRSTTKEPLRKGDALVLQGTTEAIEKFVGAADLTYRGREDPPGVRSEALSLAEAVVPQGAYIEGRSIQNVRRLRRQGVTLLGISRGGRRFRERVRDVRLKAGDLLLLFGPEELLDDAIGSIGCLPVAEGNRPITQRHKAGWATLLFALAVVAASLGWLDLTLALGIVALAFVMLRIVPLSNLYDSIEWPVIVLLGSLIPLGSALESTGGTNLIANGIVTATENTSPVVVLVLFMVVTMTLSDVLNNVATALIAAPVGIEIAARLDVNPDAFLMGAAVAASCAFLTPIGHKNNTIIMGPGGYRFGDYWRMGLPLEILVLATGVPMVLWVWPL